MPETPKTFLVIDANIAQSAGPESATHPTSKQCRDFLLAIQENGFGVVITPDLQAEWRRHGSGFWRTWYSSMMARKRTKHFPVEASAAIRSKLERCAANEGEVRAMIKDCHLLEAALASDRRVTSGETRVRRHFARACPSINEIRRIVWVDPLNSEEEAITWLENGAPEDERRRLEKYLST